MINDRYYVGFEGEPEIQFICKKPQEDDVIIMWEGYFDEIMKNIKPEKEGWIGLAYYYNMYLGWYKKSPWPVDDLYIALKQFNTLNYKLLSRESCEILQLLCKMFRNALDNNFCVLISIE